MNAELQRRIQLVQNSLNKNPDGILIGDLPAGASSSEELRPYLDLSEFFELTNGPRCGAVQFYESTALTRYQYAADHLDGGNSDWLIIGNLLNQEVALFKPNSAVHIVSAAHQITDYAVYPRLDDFLDALFGPNYLAAVDLEDDKWFQLLHELHLT